MALTEKMKSFCREYVANGGNGTEAYLTAYNSKSKVSASVEANKLLYRDDITDYIKTLNKPLENKAVNERQKKRQFLWNVIEDNTQSMSDRLRSLDILNKLDNDYININKNIEENNATITELDTTTLLRLVE
jgi:phage terminase small subunit